ncbi:serine hydrolase [Actinomadura roseirufa]|uniref:serine hydrolase n=1 Tax=Actinomadura roseirufa TaxID=2094049 RepID=UPI0013F15615|nr:serine hydrolase [Actinomadura roseirufa]
MRRHLTVLVLAASAMATAGAGLAARRFVFDGPDRGPAARTGVAGPGGPAAEGAPAAAIVRRRPFDAAALRTAVRGYLRGRPGRAGVMATDLRTGLSFGENERGRFVTASIMKVDILAGLLLQRQGTGRGLSGGERELATRMITESDNVAADALYAESGYGPGVALANRSLGLRRTTPYARSWGSSITTPADQVSLLRSLATSRSPLGAPGREYVLSLMGSVLEEQAWGVSAAARPGERVALKNGWTPLRHQGVGWAVNSIGRVTGPGHDFLLAVCSGDTPTMGSGITTVEHLAEMVTSAMRG